MTEEKAAPASGSILVVGGGISGLTTAIEAAEVGYEVFLVEKNPYLGGRVAQLNQYFPKLCLTPDSSMKTVPAAGIVPQPVSLKLPVNMISGCKTSRGLICRLKWHFRPAT
jgi:heterodisulfide reductase subunit A-like polyferredoxin